MLMALVFFRVAIVIQNRSLKLTMAVVIFLLILVNTIFVLSENHKK